MGLGRFPESQELVPQSNHIGVGNVLQPQVEGIGQPSAGLLTPKNTAVQHLVGLLLRQPALGANEAIGQLDASVVKPHGGDHAVAIKRVMHPLAIPLQAARTVAVEGALELRRHDPSYGGESHIGEFLVDVDEGAGPVAAVVGAGGGDGHRPTINVGPSSRNGL